jgi:hypothetical protein
MNHIPARRPLVLRSRAALFAFSIGMTVPLSAQSSAVLNQGAMHVTGAFDVPSVYFFRGIRQEGDPRLTMWPSVDLRVVLSSEDRPDGHLAARVGLWNSLHTGSSGTGGPLEKLHYEEDFYATLDLGLPRGMGIEASYIARTSPNGSFDTIQEADVKVSRRGAIAPYALFAFELSATGQADGGSKRGSYLELGAEPSALLPFAHVRVSVPVKLGLSLKNYYELFGADLIYRDHTFGFFDVGGRLTVPIRGVAPRFGAWNVNGGADLLTLGDTTRTFNGGDKTQVIAVVGVGVTY